MITTNTETLGQGRRQSIVSSPSSRSYIRHAASKTVQTDSFNVVKFGHLKDHLRLT